MTNLAADLRTIAELQRATGQRHARPRRIGHFLQSPSFFELDSLRGRAVGGSVSAELPFEPFLVAAAPGAGGFAGKGAPPQLVRELPQRWTGIGRVEVRFSSTKILTALCWGYGETERKRALRYTKGVIEALRGWAEVAPQLWELSPEIRTAREVVEGELAFLTPDVVDGEGTLRARIVVEEGQRYAGELHLTAEAAVFELECPVAPGFSLTPERAGPAGWWARRGEVLIGEGELDQAYVVRSEPKALELLRGLRAPLLELRDYGGSVVMTDRLRIELPIDEAYAGPLKVGGALALAIVRAGLGLTEITE